MMKSTQIFEMKGSYVDYVIGLKKMIIKISIDGLTNRAKYL